MPKLTLVYPSIGGMAKSNYVKSWKWEPLCMGVLGALTPRDWEIRFYDDRIEEINYEDRVDLVGISLETYTAKRGYQIAERFRRNGIPVVFGGFHATECPDEAMEHGDAVCVGEAENVWKEILDDVTGGRLKKRYEGGIRADLDLSRVDRALFKGKPYIPIALVETGRGCPHRCEFCSISAFYNATYRRRSVLSIIDELKDIPQDYVFFVDDNFTGHLGGAREFLKAIAPLKKKWITQTSLAGLDDYEFVKTMAQSGCTGVLIGFESLSEENLEAMGKKLNRIDYYSRALDNLRRAGIFVYGTFVFGYPSDTPRLFQRTVEFAVQSKMFTAAFNHLVPFPGTPLYDHLKEKGALRYEKWWLSPEFNFGDIPFEPCSMSAKEIQKHCMLSRKAFFGISSIMKRALDFQCNSGSWTRAKLFFLTNFLMRKEVKQKFGIPL